MRKTVFAAVVGLLALAPAAAAAPDCKEQPTVRTLLSDQGTLESVAVDGKGRLIFSVPTGLMALDRPGGAARRFADVVEPGGIAFDDAGDIIVGTGNNVENGTAGDAVGRSGLLRVDLDTGKASPFATGLSMANGVVRGGPGGAYYATNDFGSNVDRVPAGGGPAQRGWAKVESGTGVAIDSTGRWLYVAQTFRPAAIARVDLRDPSNVTPWAVASGPDVSAGLDGMTIDGADRLFVVANGAGEVWRVEGDPARICILARGLPKFPDGPSAITLGRAGSPFAPTSLYVVTFDGHVYELARSAVALPASASPGGGKTGDGASPIAPGAPGAGRQRAIEGRSIRLRVSPRRVSVGRRVRISVVSESFARGAWRPVSGVRVRVARRTLRTGKRGRASIRIRFRRRGRVLVRAASARPVAIRVVARR